MTNRRRVTIDEVFKRRAAEIRADLDAKEAYEATPEGKAEADAREAFQRRMREADARAAIEHVGGPTFDGRVAAECGAKREAPDDLNDEDEALWLEGYDSFGALD